MDADYSIELGQDDPVLDLPWADPDGNVRYHNVKAEPALVAQIPEAVAYPELMEFLRAVNSRLSAVESAKCDVWRADQLDAEEEVFGAPNQVGSYVDVAFSDIDSRRSFEFHKQFATRLVELLKRTPETLSSMEIFVRRCFFDVEEQTQEGLYMTVYVNGYGYDEAQARLNWGIALRMVGHAIVQLSASGGTQESPGRNATS